MADKLIGDYPYPPDSILNPDPPLKDLTNQQIQARRIKDMLTDLSALVREAETLGCKVNVTRRPHGPYIAEITTKL